MIIDQLPIMRLGFALRSLQGAAVPPFKGDLIHKSLLWELSLRWCARRQGAQGRLSVSCDDCPTPEGCLFARLIQPAANPAWSQATRMLVGNTPPPAYALWDMQDRRTRYWPGDGWGLELVLLGEAALQQGPAFIEAVARGAERGMGRERLRSRLEEVTALVETEEGLEETALDEEGVSDPWLTYDQATRWAAEWEGPVHALSLRYLSPIDCSEKKEQVRTPHLAPLMRALVRRLRVLSEVHGGGEWPHEDWGPLLDLAESVALVHDETLMASFSFSSKPAQGFVGQAWYASDQDLRPLLPILWLGQWLHIGKGYAYGNGRYSIAQLG